MNGLTGRGFALQEEAERKRKEKMAEEQEQEAQPPVSEETVQNIPQKEVPKEPPKEESPKEISIPHLKERLMSLPTDARKQESKIYALSKQKDKIANEKKNLELNMYANVDAEKIPSEKDPEKLVKKFTNDDVRKAETNNRLKGNKAYQDLIEAEDMILHDIHNAKIEIDYFKRELKTIDILVELMKIE